MTPSAKNKFLRSLASTIISAELSDRDLMSILNSLEDPRFREEIREVLYHTRNVSNFLDYTTRKSRVKSSSIRNKYLWDESEHRDSNYHEIIKEIKNKKISKSYLLDIGRSFLSRDEIQKINENMTIKEIVDALTNLTSEKELLNIINIIKMGRSTDPFLNGITQRSNNEKK